tara:strand:- start:487 stop:645 length:159 start_codon:yes stop_codon:yes gene_type:complete
MATPRNKNVGVTFELYDSLKELQQELDSNFGFKISLTQVVGHLLAEYRKERP